MPVVNNIVNIHVQHIEDNGSIHFGNTIHKGHVIYSHRIGTQEVIGDGSRACMASKNIVSPEQRPAILK